jgi:hypothetical protein
VIWVLFSIDNNYDQPDHNMVYWWKDRPSLHEVALALNLSFPGASDDQTLTIVAIWDGKESRIADTSYRLQQIKPGRPPAWPPVTPKSNKK